jgi:hypothetical protein
MTAIVRVNRDELAFFAQNQVSFIYLVVGRPTHPDGLSWLQMVRFGDVRLHKNTLVTLNYIILSNDTLSSLRFTSDFIVATR